MQTYNQEQIRSLFSTHLGDEVPCFTGNYGLPTEGLLAAAIGEDCGKVRWTVVRVEVVRCCSDSPKNNTDVQHQWIGNSMMDDAIPANAIICMAAVECIVHIRNIKPVTWYNLQQTATCYQHWCHSNVCNLYSFCRYFQHKYFSVFSTVPSNCITTMSTELASSQWLLYHS